MLVVRGCSLAPEQSRLGKDEGAGIQGAKGRAGAGPSQQGTVERRTVMRLRRPARRDDHDIVRLILDVAKRVGPDAQAIAGDDLAAGGRGEVPAKQDAAIEIVRSPEWIQESDGRGQIEVWRHNDE